MSKAPEKRFQEVLRSFTTGMLVTQTTDDGLRGRPMRVADVESDSDLWFCLRTDSPKTKQIAKRPDVAVVFQDAGRFLTLAGKATVTQERAQIDRLWNESWRVWFPDGKRDEQLALLHIDATSGEYWDNSGLRSLTLAIRAGAAYWHGNTPDVPPEMNAKVTMSDATA